MKIFGFDVSSLLTQEVRSIVTSYKFVSTFSDYFPTFTSYSAEDRELRSLTIIKPPNLGFHFNEGYKFFITNIEGRGGLNSLSSSDRILIYINSSKIKIGNMEILIPKLNFLGFKKDKPYVLLSLKDLPIIGNNKDEIVSEVRKLLRDEYGIIVDDIPAVIIYSNKVKVKAKIEDIDYAYILP